MLQISTTTEVCMEFKVQLYTFNKMTMYYNYNPITLTVSVQWTEESTHARHKTKLTMK